MLPQLPGNTRREQRTHLNKPDIMLKQRSRIQAYTLYIAYQEHDKEVLKLVLTFIIRFETLKLSPYTRAVRLRIPAISWKFSPSYRR